MLSNTLQKETFIQSHTQMIRKAFLCAFPHTPPDFCRFLVPRLTYGIYMNVSGFPFWYPALMSLTIFFEFSGICNSQYASWGIRSASGTGTDIDD